jgi:hypothetical protein
MDNSRRATPVLRLKKGGKIMAATLTRKCGSCGEQHELCLETPDLRSGDRTYEYVCPKTRIKVRFMTERWGKTVPGCPRGSVVVALVGQA